MGRGGEERSGNESELKGEWEGHSVLRDRTETEREEEGKEKREME